MAKEKVLIIEDDEDIRELEIFNLKQEGWKVLEAETAEEGLESVKTTSPDIILLDLMLPGMSGLDFCRKIKSMNDYKSIPIIMVSAKGEESDIVTGLELGADDYVVKPFRPRELVARVRAVLRRKLEHIPADEEILRIGELEIHPGRHEVHYKSKKVDLTFTEFRILQIMAQRPGWVFTRYQLVDLIRGDDYPVTDRSVDVQIVGLRKKLGKAEKFIETVRGVGYRFKTN
ncbi:MAG: response regulator transcription factor [Kiritimatiellae bacterium]|jgi:two-component system alkaline phosphatase synthesis response regulator PhoP|nr:response regulator transcription factor [Kiritimatiellia bacterium]